LFCFEESPFVDVARDHGGVFSFVYRLESRVEAALMAQRAIRARSELKVGQAGYGTASDFLTFGGLMGGIITLLMIIYLIGIGVVLAPTGIASEFSGRILQELPVAAAWP
jgi:hypothetical protein